jgi:hypothetical protein
MKNLGFVVNDLFETDVGSPDGAWPPIDMAYAREHGRFRAVHIYANIEERSRRAGAVRRLR